MLGSRVICRNVPFKLISLSMEARYLCSSERHKYGAVSGTQLCYLVLWRLIFARNLVYFQINTISYTYVQTAKNRKKMPYFQTKQSVTALRLMSHGGGEQEYSNALFSKTKDTIDLKTC